MRASPAPVCIAALIVITCMASCNDSRDDSESMMTSTTNSVSTPTPTPSDSGSAPPTSSDPPEVNTEAIDRLDEAYLDDDASDQAYWARVVELLSEQDDATLVPGGDMRIIVTHEGETVTLYRDDLDSIAFNSCSELAHGETAADTVSWITDAFDLQRRWEAAQIRTSALEAKCPALAN
jgi:hypothetical protein